MNILFLTQILPYPPDAGPKVKTYHVLRALAGQGDAVTLVSFVRPEEVPHIPALKKTCKAVYGVPIRRSRLADAGHMVRSYLTNRPFLIERDDSQRMLQLVNDLVRDGDFGFIHADQLTMVQFALQAAAAIPGKKPKVIFDAHNAVWTIMERMREHARWFLKPLLGMEARRVKRYEGELLKRVDHVLAVTDADRTSLEEALKSTGVRQQDQIAAITVIPIAIDTQQLRPITRQPASKHIVTLGALHYPPNSDGIRWFVNDVFPLVRRRIPEASLAIIGKNPPRDFLDAAARNPEAIQLTGYVPELAPYLAQSSLMVVPVRAGGGMRVRILEAFAYAMPLVTTTIGLEGIQAEIGKDVLVADTAAGFAERVCELLENVSLQARLAANGRRLAETKYDWQVVLPAMKAVYGR
jgi:glycosyltransferase involved in cell wall biosynthesis